MLGIGYQELLVLGVVGLLPAMIAWRKGGSFGAWWIYGTLLLPIALLHVMLRKRDRPVLETRQLKDGSGKRCPFCAETIKAEAVVCRYCGRTSRPRVQPDVGPVPQDVPVRMIAAIYVRERLPSRLAWGRFGRWKTLAGHNSGHTTEARQVDESAGRGGNEHPGYENLRMRRSQ